MAKNLKASGFPELTPDKQVIQNNIKEIIARNYKKTGYINIDTPTVELNSVLTAKGGEEVAKQIFGLYGLAQGAEDAKDYSMHFDLTVPFARYVIEHENELKFPFKRYAIGKVFRGERPQKCRYREFYQCDIDVINENLDINYDIEVIDTLYNTVVDIVDFLELDTKLEVHINNKHIINGICEKFSINDENRTKFFSLLDDFYKLPAEKFDSLLIELAGENNEEIKSFLQKELKAENFEGLGEEITSGVADLIQIYETLKDNGVNVIFDPYITRGLDYYTGVVFETFVIREGVKPLSICSGGRYDNLVGAIRDVSGNKGKNYAGVGGSIGLSRLFCVLEDSGLITKTLPLSDLLIFNLGASANYLNKIRKELKDTDLNVDIYYGKAKLDKQFKYAESKNIPLAIFAGGSEEESGNVVVKNLEKRTEETISLSELKNYFE